MHSGAVNTSKGMPITVTRLPKEAQIRSWVHNLLTAATRLRGVNGRPYLAVVMTCGMSLHPFMEDNQLRSRAAYGQSITVV